MDDLQHIPSGVAIREFEDRGTLKLLLSARDIEHMRKAAV
jgi:hypothetical protein